MFQNTHTYQHHQQQEVMSKFSKVSENWKSIYKNQLYFYTLAVSGLKMINIKKNQILRNTFNKRSAKFIFRKPQDIVEGNYKTMEEWKNLLCS